MSGWTDRFVPDGGGGASFDRGRVLVLGAFGSSAVAAFFFVHRLYLEPELGPQHALVGISALWMGAIPFVLRATGAYRLSSHLLVAGLGAMLAVDGWFYGGVDSPVLLPMVVLPLMATFYLGVRGGIGYALATALVLVLYHQLARAGVEPGRPSPALVSDMRLFAGLGMLGFVALLASIYERERIDSLARTRAVTDNLADGVLAVDLTGRIVAANPAARTLLRAEGLAGRQAATALPEALASLVTTASGSPATETVRVELPGGRVGEAAASPILLEGGRRSGTAVILRDVTLEASVDRMKTDFIATVSHEMRTPLTSVLGFAKLIRTKLESDVFPHVPGDDRKSARAVGRVRQNVDIIIQEGQRLTAMINDVLDIAKMESGRMEWRMEEDVDPASLVRRTLDAAGGLFEGGKVALESAVDDALPGLRGDPDRLQQVLLNLVSNARKFTREGSVTVSARALEGRVELSVADTGPGIAEEDRLLIFDRFRQSSGDALVDRPRGTGLGLSICREIVDAHGGTIRVESELGVGSRFIVELPAG